MVSQALEESADLKASERCEVARLVAVRCVWELLLVGHRQHVFLEHESEEVRGEETRGEVQVHNFGELGVRQAQTQ